MLETRFHYVARAVIIEHEHVLLVRDQATPYAYLPGGHIGLGESAIKALAREIREELGLDCTVGPYLGAVEHGWLSDGVDHIEMNHLFWVTLEGWPPLTDPVSKEPHLTFYWVPVRSLEHHRLQPTPLVSLIKHHQTIQGAWWGSTLD
ncbi:MAG: NUDIX domain-containing protein [Sulfobacillus sp.]|nr:NUDIX domain-containing protein [Sulfobacillus sp.]